MLLQADARSIPLRDVCVQCVVTSPPYFGLRDYGAAGQIGLEPTPDAYVQQLVTVFREVRRVLADDGVLWLNLGDSYAGANAAGGWREGSARADGEVRGDGATSRRNRNGNGAVDGVKPKDLIGIPWRVAFALQADGWYLRSDVIWHKPNPMPESVTDRPTKSHEYLFLLTKSERYFYDAEAIAELAECAGGKAGYAGYSERAASMGREPSGNEKPGVVAFNKDTRNRRSVWTIATTPYSGAHFATMPEKLVEPCIMAGSRLGDYVFDPFIGSGTVGAVAKRLKRRWVGQDLNSAYLSLAKERTADVPLPLFDLTPPEPTQELMF